MVIGNAYLVGVETHGEGAFGDSEVLELPLEIWVRSEERTSELVVPHHWAKEGVCQVNSDLGGRRVYRVVSRRLLALCLPGV